MVGLLLLTSALLGIDPGDAATPPGERDSYEAALAQVGRDADAHVRLALWCEAHGLQPERLRHLTLAVLNNPSHSLARGLLGLVAYQGRWKRPEAVVQAVADDAARKALVAQYEERRDKLPETADAHWKLALWCEENGLRDEEVAHLWSAVRLDPSREAAWKRLGYKRHNGRWATDAQLAREKQETELQKRADHHWKVILEKWRSELSEANEVKRAAALDGLAGVSDPRAVPAVWTLFANGDESLQRMAVQVLGQIDVAAASRALAYLAVFSKTEDVRRAAIETLRGRDVREYAGPLIALLRDPIKYEVRPVNGPGNPGSIFIEGERVNVQRRYEAPPLPEFRFNPQRDTLTYDANGLPVILPNTPPGAPNLLNPAGGAAVASTTFAPNATSNALFGWGGNNFNLNYNYGFVPQGWGMLPMTSSSPTLGVAVNPGRKPRRNSIPVLVGQAILNTQAAAATAQQQLMNDVAALDRQNDETNESNGHVLPVLNNATGQDLPANRETWQRWLVDQFGYPQRVSDTQLKPTVVEEFAPNLPTLSGYVSTSNGYSQIVSHHSCFGAGTLVHTLSGARPIETLRVGDVVLTQDVKTGALSHRPIVVVHHNPPIETVRITFGSESIVSSLFHRFWKAGKGWVMARDLKAGDTLRTLEGALKIEAVEAAPKQPVFNLDVAEDADFFVGRTGALVHDHTLPDLRQAPFDAVPGLAAVHP